MAFFQKVGQMLIDNSIEITIEINNSLGNHYNFLLKEGYPADDFMKSRAKFISLIGKAILKQDDNIDDIVNEVTSMAKEIAKVAVQREMDVDEVILTSRSYRRVIWNYIEKEIELDTVKGSSVLKVNQLIESLLDQTIYIFSATYMSNYKQNIAFAQKTFNEVSFPVVALSDKIAILPLIGELTEERGSILLEIVLPKCTNLGVEELILDLSGVPRVDTLAANQLFQLKDALNLIGVSLTFTGISPKLALPMLNLGIPVNQLNVKGNLKRAISSYIKMGL